jgi:uncharacterized SAM-binding protein YcdF (DUF218 family)
MDEVFRWKLLLKALILPPVAPLLLAFVGIALLSRRPRLGRALALAGLALLTALSLPIVAESLVRVVDRTPPIDLARAKDAQAIVILGGGLRRRAPEYGGDTMSRLTLERVRYGALVARATGLPVLVSGGRFAAEDSTEAAVMKKALADEYGITPRWAEDRSQNTHENAQMSAALLRADGVERVILVAHAFDMPRATAEFADAGIVTIPAPTGMPAERRRAAVLDFVPSVFALQASYYALYEIYANLWRRIAPASEPPLVR